jgi:hypothetical protein
MVVMHKRYEEGTVLTIKRKLSTPLTLTPSPIVVLDNMLATCSKGLHHAPSMEGGHAHGGGHRFSVDFVSTHINRCQ